MLPNKIIHLGFVQISMKNNIKLYPSWFNCLEKACHCVGRYYFFGTYEFMHEKIAPELIEYGFRLRTNYAKFIKTGEMEDFTPMDFSDRRINYFKSGSMPELTERFKDECLVFDEIDHWMNV